MTHCEYCRSSGECPGCAAYVQPVPDCKWCEGSGRCRWCEETPPTVRRMLGHYRMNPTATHPWEFTHRGPRPRGPEQGALFPELGGRLSREERAAVRAG